MTAPAIPAPPSALHYHVSLHDAHAHFYRVRLSIARPAAPQTVSLPVWIPGSYLVREFAKNLHQLSATQGGQPCPAEQISKNTWRLDCQAGQPLVLEYLVSAYEPSVRAAWLDSQRGFFNGTSLFLRVWGQEGQPHQLHMERPDPSNAPFAQDWELATALQPVQVDAAGFGLYQAAHYDELADSPVEMGTFWSGSFTACGVPHRFVVAGAAPSFDGERLLADTQKICEAQIRFWHPDGAAPPHDRYVFMLNATHDGYGGLEHCHSTALICQRADLPRQGQSKASEGYIGLLGLISHEYFHTWNVKRLRPASLLPYNYEAENYTELLWFFEGLTSYYDDLFLRRCGLISTSQYLQLLTKTVQQVQQTAGRQVQSLAQSSFDAWVKFYRQDAHTSNHTVSYYSKGALVGLCLDLSLRQQGQSLDALMRLLWRCHRHSGLQEADILAALYNLSGQCWQQRLSAWVHGTDELPLAELLPAFGISLQAQAPTPAQALGLRVKESEGSIHIRQVLSHSPAQQAGMMPGDEWYGLEVLQAGSATTQSWRLQRLADLALYAPPSASVQALIARDQRLLRLPLTLPPLLATTPPTDTADSASPADGIGLSRLHQSDAATASAWLGNSSAPKCCVPNSLGDL